MGPPREPHRPGRGDGTAARRADRQRDAAIPAARRRAPRRGLPPSPLVDIGWHTFILYTREYAAFCDRVAARFIHHSPKDGAGTAGASGSVADTAEALRRLDGAIDEDLWVGAADLSANCNSGDGKCCSSSDDDSKTTGN